MAIDGSTAMRWQRGGDAAEDGHCRRQCGSEDKDGDDGGGGGGDGHRRRSGHSSRNNRNDSNDSDSKDNDPIECL